MTDLPEQLISVNIVDEMKSAYIDYSMSVIVSRALPDVRDGLKPVHRRVLYGMYDLGVSSKSAHKKSARIVGEVLGKYHPHGDSSVYDSMVRMAQEWSLRYTMVDGQGNFGSIDGDSPAAMRYTEARLKKISEDILGELDKDTVDFQLNFDDTLKEPVVLPTRIPNLLVNGASGIAVGMATNMAPHNLTEVINAIIAYIKNIDISIPELMEYVKAPDFPTGGTIYGYDGVKEAYHTGKGRVVLRAKVRTENIDGKDCLLVDEIPYQVNKSEMIKKTADLINDKKIEGISTIRDESDRNGMRIVYVLKNNAIPEVILNHLYKYTALQTSFSINNIALVNGRPKLLNLKDLVVHFVEHRHEVVVRRTKFELDQAEKKAHILAGLIIALDNLDAVIKLIRSSKSVESARSSLMESFSLSEIQAKSILDMRLQKLTNLESAKIKDEYEELLKLLERLKNILSDESLRKAIIQEELEEVKEKYGDQRRSDIVYTSNIFKVEDMIPDEEVVVTISHAGYIKRTPLTEYRTQYRGGVGQKGVSIRDEDFLEHVYIATNHQYILFFTEKGRCHWLRVFEIPKGAKTSKGRPIQNLINIDPDDKIRAFIRTDDLKDEEYVNSHYVIMVTKNGIVKKTSLEKYSRPRQNGINAITIQDNDRLLEAQLTNGKSHVVLAGRSGKAVIFDESKIRASGRTSSGVKGITLKDDGDEAIGMVCVEDMNSEILVVSENGYGKRSKVEDYRITNRGAKGVKTISITDKTGGLIAIKNVNDENDLIVISKSGITIRMSVEDIRIMGRNTQGVKVLNLKSKDVIASVTKVPKVNDEDNGNDQPSDINEGQSDINEEIKD
ncbi:DNA gyrase subunit A [Ichthyobacterium seriolicida]|uniref:DNA gyrase subunit A n=1 Tax=Ichthyobacterium seriolicida TaxID=242600 RepID=A0A1J1E4I5_9FLAO|nr:DNA gyrase subunit A [Ichthyobacterium seriolicida]BAV94964.1 DNA gyrase subunit A [Ichthyobacterium seriolicida]